MEKIFEFFTTPGIRRGTNRISFNKAGGWTFSAGFCQENKIKKFTYVVLGYNRKTSEVAFLFTNDDTPGALKLSHRSSSSSVRSVSFLNTYEIDPNVYSGRFTPQSYSEQNTGKKIFYIDLKEKK